MTSVQTGVREYQQFIGGDWIDGEGGAFEDRDPFTGDVVALVRAGTRADAARAVDAASGAFPAWSQSVPAERQRIFLKAADVLEGRLEEIVGLLARETGASFGFGMFQMGFVPNLLRQAAALAYAPAGQIFPSDHPGTLAMGLRKPVGVVAAIAPWNAALILSARSIAAPLALGNTVVLKPSELSPVVGGLIWGEIFAEAGLPAGVLNVVTHAPGEAAPIGDELVENKAVRRINFTGSTETGRRLAEACGRQLKRVVLELGGHNPLIVLADADLDYAVNASIFGSFLHQGQICMSSRRIFVEQPVAEEFTSRLAAKAKTLKTGDPNEHDTIIGPLINESALAMVKDVSKTPSRRAPKCSPAAKPTALATRRPCSPTSRRTPSSHNTRRSALWSRSRRSARRRRLSHGRTPRATASAQASSPATPTVGSRSRSSSTRGSRTSTTSRSATSRRCRSAASRTRASGASAARR